MVNINFYYFVSKVWRISNWEVNTKLFVLFKNYVRHESLDEFFCYLKIDKQYTSTYNT